MPDRVIQVAQQFYNCIIALYSNTILFCYRYGYLLRKSPEIIVIRNGSQLQANEKCLPVNERVRIKLCYKNMGLKLTPKLTLFSAQQK